MLKRIDHIGVIVDDLEEAKTFLERMGMEFDRDLHIEGRLKAAFYRCGDTMIEVIDVYDPGERARRLGEDKARVEHIAIEVDGLQQTLSTLQGLGIKTTSPDALKIGRTLNYWTEAATCDGVQYQLVEKEPAG
jgi:methylmalonyl-CoA/ethylmalonyl-CoA epimerase